MCDWKRIGDAAPKNGDMAIILAESTNGWGTVFKLGPQLCVYDDGQWVQMLRGDYYGLGLDGTPTHWLPVPITPSAADPGAS